MFDTARRDAFEPHGAPAGATPAVAQLARAGTAHQQMYAPASWTVPSHASLFTGLLPRAAGLGHQGGALPRDFRAAIEHNHDRLLPEVLRRAGWATAGISANAWIHRSSGFNRGFEQWRSLHPHRHHGLTGTSWRERARWYATALRAHLDAGAARVEDQLAQWRAQHDGRPFFWFVNLVECHSPYLPPRPFTSLGPFDRLRSAFDARRHQTLEGFWRASLSGWSGTDAALGRMRAQYGASIRLLDDWLARVLEDLDEHGLLDETQVIVTSDHGENFGENTLLGHSFSLDDRLIRVPFVSAGPVELDLPMRAGLHDLPASLARAIGLSEHPWEGSGSCRDIAVAQFDAPGRRGDPRTQGAVRAWSLDARATERLCTSFTGATDGRWKLLRLEDGREQLIDLAADLLEERPIELRGASAPIDVEILEQLRRALDEAADDERPPLARPPDSGPDTSELNELEEQLRLLGYL